MSPMVALAVLCLMPKRQGLTDPCRNDRNEWLGKQCNDRTNDHGAINNDGERRDGKWHALQHTNPSDEYNSYANVEIWSAMI